MSLDIAATRAQFPALANYTWFQNGGVSITPAPVADEHARLMRELLERGPLHIIYPEEEYPRRATTMARLAGFFGVEAGELALMRGVSEAFLTVIRGIDWKPGDRIVISADEEAALLLPCLHLRDRHGVEVVKAPLVHDAPGAVEAVVERLSEDTRLLALSHVTTDMGYRFPAEAICAAARMRGVWSFLDLAHSAGVIPVDVHALGCDFAGLLSYKWMYSPYASGALYVRRELVHQLPVTYAGGRGEKALDFEADTYELHDTAERFQFGPWSWPLVHAWAFAADWLRDLGLEAIWERTAALAGRLKDGLAAIPGARLYTPASPELSAALVSFGLGQWRGADLSTRLRERRIIIKPLPHGREGLRASLPFFLLEEEVDLLLEELVRAGLEGPQRTP